MEGKSAPPDMISMSRPSRENRSSSKNLKGSTTTTSDFTSNPPPRPKKSQIRASGSSPRGPPLPASKKAKTRGETLAGVAATSSASSKKAEIGSTRSSTIKSSSNNHALTRDASRSKRASEQNGGGDVTLDALRPAKKRKISRESGGAVTPSSSSPQIKSLKKPEGENGTHTAAAASPAATTSKPPPPNYALRNPKSGGAGGAAAAGTDIINNAGQSAEEITARGGGGGSAHRSQIGSRAGSGITPNGLAGRAAAEKRKEHRRGLRPRPKPTAPKVKKRTRFHEVTLGEGDGPRIVGRRIKVYWPLEEKFFYGHVKAFNGARKLQHKIVYDDKDEEWLRLQNEVFGIELLPGEVFGAAASAPPATEPSTTAPNFHDLDDSDEHTGAATTAADDGGGADTRSVEPSTTEGRIKPEGVYRRTRKADRTSEEEKTSQQLEGGGGINNKHEKKPEGGSEAKKGEGHGEAKEKGEGDGESKKKTEGAGGAAIEQKKRSDGKRGGVRKKGEANDNKQRRALAERLGRANAKRSAGNSGVRDLRKKAVQVMTSRGRREKAMMTTEGPSSGRRKRLGKEKVGKGGTSSIQTRARNSNLADKEGRKKLRNRIRDDDRLFSSVKSSSAVVRRKVSESKRSSKESKSLRSSTSDAKKHSSAPTQIEENIPVEEEKLVSSFGANVREGKQAEDPQSDIQRANALGPFEAVMDAYLEALSGPKDVPTIPANRVPEGDQPAETVMEEDGALVKNDSSGSQDHDREGLGEAFNEGGQLTSGSSSPGAHLTSSCGTAAAATTSLQVHEVRHQVGDEAERDLQDGEQLSVEGQRISGEVSTTEVVLTPLIPLVTRLRPELKKSPDKVYRRVKKYQPDKVYRRLKHSDNKVPNKGVDGPADIPQNLVPVTRYWSLARPLPPAPHVLSYGARIAALGSSLQSFDRIAFNRLQCRSSSSEEDRWQLGTFYGAPGILSLLRVSWTSLRWLFAPTSVSVNAVEATSSVESTLGVRKIKFSKLLPVSPTNRGFKRPGVSRRKASRHVSQFRQLYPRSNLKRLLLNAPYLKGLRVRSRRRGSVLRRSILLGVGAPPTLASVPPEPSQGLVISSVHLTPSHGQLTGDLCAGQLLLNSDVLRRALALFNPWIRRRRSPPIDVVLCRALEAGARAWSVGPVSPLEHGRSCMKVGAYYGRRTLQSFLRVSRNEPFRMNVGSLSFTQSGDGTVSADLRNVLRAIADMHAAGGGDDNPDSVARVGLVVPGDLHGENMPSSILSAGDVVYESVQTRMHETTPFMGPWFIDATTASFQGAIGGSGLVLPRSGGAIPRSVSVMLGTGNTAGLGDVFISATKSPAEVEGWDLETNGRKIGAHYGPPSVQSLLRVSKDFWLRLLGAQRKVWQPVKEVSSTPITVPKEVSGALPRPQSSMETMDDDEISDQEDRIQVTSGEGTGVGDSSVGRPEQSVLGDDLDSIKAPSRSFGPMKKGRRTGKGLKRGFAQSGGDSLGRDGLAADRFSDGDVLSGRPYSKRTRVEIESSGAATSRDNGVEACPPTSDLGGKGLATPPLSVQEKSKGSALPRVNVLKLRRCPTNKGVWLVAGNSCATPQDTGMRVGSVEAEASAPLDSRDFVACGDSITPIFETSRKRVLDQFLESPSLVRNDHLRTPAAAVTPAGANAVSSADSQAETTASGLKSAKAFSLNANSQEVWFDCGITSLNGGVLDGLETRKRRRKGPSPIPGDYADGTSEHSARRSADSNWGTCTANVLITKSDRCVRETGATVELQSGHANSCMLTISLNGESKYALKADQPVASGTTNKFTHSMMWRGGKAWSLEFVDRKQWQLFKDLHEECFQRNARAASVRHIPIPGVKQIQEGPKSGHRFMRPPLKYIRQLDGEVEMAFSSTRVIYDMDSEDEEWLNQVNSEKVIARGTRSRPKVDEDTLERVMDKLEKTSFIRKQDPMSADVAAELCQALGSQDVIKSIHLYWSEKRQRKGMALIRHFQPAPWEQYQKQLQEWQGKVDQLQQQSPTAPKQQLQSVCKRPPLFAFCLRPRGLETRNKMQKQRSQRKQGLGGSSSRQWTVAGPPSDFFLDSPSKRQPSADSAGGSFYGARKFVRQRIQEDNFSDPMAVDLTESFNAIAGEGFTSLADVGQATSEGPGVVDPRVDNSSALQFETSTTGGFKKRMKKLGRKAKKMKLVAAAEESRRKRQLRAQQAHLNGRFIDAVQSPHSPSEMSPFPIADPSTSGILLPHMDGQEEDKVAKAIAAEALAKAKRETAITLRSRAQALHAVADAAMHKAVAAVIAADAIHAAEREVEESTEREKLQPIGNHRQQTGEVPAAVKDDLRRPWGRSEASGGGASFGSWRRALNSASKNANHLLSKGSSSKPGLMTDMDDALLPVASWSQELGAGLGTRLLQAGEVSPQRQRYSPGVVEGLSKSPARGVRGEGLVSLGRTRGESMMAMLTR